MRTHSHIITMLTITSLPTQACPSLGTTALDTFSPWSTLALISIGLLPLARPQTEYLVWEISPVTQCWMYLDPVFIVNIFSLCIITIVFYILQYIVYPP